MRCAHCLVFASSCVLASIAAAQDAASAVEEHLAANGHAALAEYAELLTIPNVYGDTPNIERTAEQVRAALAARGVETQLLTLDGASPIVYGRIDTPGATRTIGVYLHYDGQPVDPTAWTTGDPWSATLYTDAVTNGGHPIPLPGPGETIDPEWRLYARSASDDKAPFFTILAALDAMRARDIAPTVNLVFFFEGEEEAGSPHLEAHLQRNRALIDDIDVWLFCDGPSHQSGRMQLVFGVRGVTGMEITVYGAVRPLHSGHYGNWAPNPAIMLAQLLAGMKDEDGNVAIEGFYDSVAPLSEEERAALDAIPPVDEQMKQELGLARTEGDAPLAERLLLPSLNIRGMRSANVGEEARNVIPTHATASIDIRLVKGNDPDAMIDLVEDHIRSQGYHIVRETPDMATRLAHERLALVRRGEGYPAARTSMALPVVQPVIAAAESVAPDLVLTPALGGSLPLYLFTVGLDKPVVIVPIANHDNNQHAADENIRLGNLWQGAALMGALFTMEE
jgi:acetylornithine deacetylase/succinyl-diaminopimelate desuccinylase-like protein